MNECGNKTQTSECVNTETPLNIHVHAAIHYVYLESLPDASSSSSCATFIFRLFRYVLIASCWGDVFLGSLAITGSSGFSF